MYTGQNFKTKKALKEANPPLVDGQTHQTCSFPTKAKSEQVWCEICHVWTDAFRLNQGNVSRHTTKRLDSFVDAVAGKRLTFEALTA